jgi:serine/threonine protein kinase/Tol biopolymer transport system component
VARTLEPEDRIARYRIVGPLGAGGMGEVYIARDETLDRSVALKILPPGLVRNDERVRRFVTEAKSASSLNHPNIVTIYEIGHDRVVAARPVEGSAPATATAGAAGEGAAEPVHYIAMELVVGETLDQKIHHEKTDLRTLLGWLAQAAEGIAKAHAAGIVHRDLKPGNIMISKDGFAKVLDFGLAKLTERGVTDAERTSAPTQAVATGAGVVMGTVGYMSPEQVQARSVDHRSDIFSLGCILYEAATRRRPFVADSDIEVMHLILKDKPPSIEEVNPEVPGEVRRLVRRCLAKSPDQRFQSMKDLAIDLREAVEEWDTLSTSTPSGRTAVSGSGPAAAAPPRAASLPMIAAILIGLAGAGFGLYAFLHRGATGGAGEAGVLQNLRITPLLSRDDLLESALSADGRYLAYVTLTDRIASLKVRQVRTGSDVVIVPESEQQIQGIAFSRDGDYLYYLNRDADSPNYNALFQVPSLGGAPRKVLFDVDSAPTFSPDGKRACVRRGMINEGADSLLIVDLDTMQEHPLVKVTGELVTGPPAWSPDGKTIVAGLQDTRKGVKTVLNAFDVASGKRTAIGPTDWVEINSIGWRPDGRSVLVSALDVATSGGAFQIHRVAWPGGETLRLTNDLDGYTNLSIAVDGSATAIRRVTVDNLWVARPESKAEPQAITFASGSANSVQGAQALPQGAVAFSAPRDNKTFVWRVQADGSNRRQLTSQGAFVINMQYAPGAGLVFTQVDESSPLLAHVWRMDPDGGGLKRLTEGNGEQLVSVSPRGDYFAYSPWDDPQRSVLVRKIEGGEPRRLGAAFTGEGALFSWDGRKVLHATLEQVQGRFFPRRHVMDVESGREEASFLLPPGAATEQWSPDGASITYVDRNHGWNLWRKPLPDGEPQPVTSFTDGQVLDYTWAPDGSRLVLHRRVGPRDSLWMLKTGSGQPTLITEFKSGRVTGHLWAPDEPILYFAYGNSTQDVVMVTGVK